MSQEVWIKAESFLAEGEVDGTEVFSCVVCLLNGVRMPGRYKAESFKRDGNQGMVHGVSAYEDKRQLRVRFSFIPGSSTLQPTDFALVSRELLVDHQLSEEPSDTS